MPLITSQKINEYFDTYKNTEVTLTKGLIGSLGIITKQIYLKFKDGHLPCIVYSTTMVSAKIIISLSSEQIRLFNEEKSLVSIKFCFQPPQDKRDPIAFFIQGRVSGINHYNKNNNLYFTNISFTQRPPDDYIELFGGLLEANTNAAKRKEERIIITADTIRKMGINSKSASVIIDRIPRNCILRDLSFSGAKIIVMGNAKFLLKKPVILKIGMARNVDMELLGKIVRFEAVEGRKDLAALAVLLDSNSMPLEYKMMINNFISSQKSKVKDDT